MNTKYILLRHTNKPYRLVESVISWYVLHIYGKTMKVKKTITIDKDLLEWIERKIKEKEFGSVSHAIEKALTKLREQNEKKGKIKS